MYSKPSANHFVVLRLQKAVGVVIIRTPDSGVAGFFRTIMKVDKIAFKVARETFFMMSGIENNQTALFRDQIR